jgi:hypothetical protein
VKDLYVRKMSDSAEDITHRWERFTLKEDESDVLAIGESVLAPLLSRGSSCVVGKLLADRVVSKETIKTPMIRAWHPSGRVTFKNLGENLFLIEFQYEWDKDRIMEGRPWTFDGHLLSLVDYDGVTPLAQLEFDKAAFWVRMSNLPLACMSREVGLNIGSSMGVVEEVDVDDDGVGWGEFLRVRVILDLSKPLPRGRTIRVREKSVWVTFKYEKIPKFCFKCGVVRHGSRGCEVSGGRRTNGGWSEDEYGLWLRVPSPNRRQGANRGRGYMDRAGQNEKEDREDFRPVMRRNFADGSGGSKWQVKSGGGRAAPLEGEEKQWHNHGSDVGSSEFSAAPVERGSKSRDCSRSITHGNSGIHGEIKEMTDMERTTGKYGERGGGKTGGTGAVLEGGNNMGVLHVANNKEGERLTGAEKGKNIYIGQWDTIKARMVWEAVDKNQHGWMGESQGGQKSQSSQGEKDVAQCMVTQLGGNGGPETDVEAAVQTSVFRFGVNGPESRGQSSPIHMVKKRKNKQSKGKEGQGESESLKLGKRKDDRSTGIGSSWGVKRNRVATTELLLQDDISAEAGGQPRREQ